MYWMILRGFRLIGRGVLEEWIGENRVYYLC